MKQNKILMASLKNVPLILCVGIFLIFGILTPNFLTVGNFVDILTAVAYVGILAMGMTFVIITGGIDLSIGSIVYFSTLVPAILMSEYGFAVWPALLVGILIGCVFGLVNAFFIVKVGMIPFLVTLCTMVTGRGLGIFLCSSQGRYFPREVVEFANRTVMGIPIPILLLAIVTAVAFVIQRYTSIGRRIYAVGYDTEYARKAGVNTLQVRGFAYVICGLFSALGGMMSVFQLGGLVNPGMGEGVEFQAIAAAVLGGTSLAGGAGSVFPGTLLGAFIIKMLDAGLIYLGTDVYFQPIISALVIFLAVLIDSFRSGYITKIERRNIRVESN